MSNEINNTTNLDNTLTIEAIEACSVENLDSEDTLRVSEFLENNLKEMCIARTDLTQNQIIETLIESMSIKTMLEATWRLKDM